MMVSCADVCNVAADLDDVLVGQPLHQPYFSVHVLEADWDMSVLDHLDGNLLPVPRHSLSVHPYIRCQSFPPQEGSRCCIQPGRSPTYILRSGVAATPVQARLVGQR